MSPLHLSRFSIVEGNRHDRQLLSFRPSRGSYTDLATQLEPAKGVIMSNVTSNDVNATDVMTNGSKCPYSLMHTTGASKGNQAWWPEQLNIEILHQHSSLSNPMSSDFDYAKE